MVDMGKVRDFEMPANPFSKGSKNLRGVGSEESSKFRSLLLGENFEEKSNKNENFNHQNNDFLDFEKSKSGLFLVCEDAYDSSKDSKNKTRERNSLNLDEQESIVDMIDSIFDSTVREVESNLSNSNSLKHSQNYRSSNFRTSNSKTNKPLSVNEKEEINGILDDMFSSTAREVLSNLENPKTRKSDANFKPSASWGTSLGGPSMGNDTNFNSLEYPQNYRPSNFRTSNSKTNRPLSLNEKEELNSILDDMFSNTACEVLSNLENPKTRKSDANFKPSASWGTSLGSPSMGNDTNFNSFEHPQNYRSSNFRTSNSKTNRPLSLNEKEELNSILEDMFSSTAREVLSNLENPKTRKSDANFKPSTSWGTSLGSPSMGNDTNFENIADLRDTLIDENVKNGTLRESKTINRNNIMAKIDTGGYDMSRALNTDASGKGEFRKISPEENKYFDSVFSRKDSNKRGQSGAQDGELNENKMEDRSKSTAANIFDLETILSQKGSSKKKGDLPTKDAVTYETSGIEDGLDNLASKVPYSHNAMQTLGQTAANKKQNLDLLKKGADVDKQTLTGDKYARRPVDTKHPQGLTKNFDPKGGQTKSADNTKGALFSGEVEMKSKPKVRDFDEKFDKRPITDDSQPVNKQDILPNQVANPGDAILGNLRHTSEVYSAGAVQGVEAQTKTIQNIGVEVAERIIASHAALNAKQEVRISLKDSILPQTEVRIAKNEKSGVLQVGFFTSADRSAEFLATNQSNLRLHLLENLRNVSDVEVSIHHDAPNNQQSDGRSKQEYVGDSSEDDEDYRR